MTKLVTDGLGGVFVVIGSIGDFSDREEWVVCACSCEGTAQDIVAALSEDWAQIRSEHPSPAVVEGGHPMGRHDGTIDCWDDPTYRYEAAPFGLLEN